MHTLRGLPEAPQQLTGTTGNHPRVPSPQPWAAHGAFALSRAIGSTHALPNSTARQIPQVHVASFCGLWVGGTPHAAALSPMRVPKGPT